MATHVVDILDPVRKGSEGSWEGKPSGHSDTPYQRHRNRRAPGHQRVGTQSEAVEDEHRQDKQEVEQQQQQPVWDPEHQGLPPG